MLSKTLIVCRIEGTDSTALALISTLTDGPVVVEAPSTIISQCIDFLLIATPPERFKVGTALTLVLVLFTIHMERGSDGN